MANVATFKALVIIILVGASTITANAVDLKDYSAVKHDESFQMYLNGVAEGYGWANAALKTYRDQRPFFCQPGKLRLNKTNYIKMVDDHISKSDSITPNTPVELILLMALMEVFPCQ